ncbi:MAG: HAMP domain-containing histidine kinase [Azonexus sp.]|jgi:signal transduction histidine kinase|uniref:sensor histidine kinase n=1 Tax=Azonexus sp. TaxID=1872668 RepID=UPI002822C323|nr:HAMP domain-containing sensor histidine kinase [Azonexus sp.]MDR0776644.1 HAMP domain-containing histidine kinase [Azonexus sp.]
MKHFLRWLASFRLRILFRTAFLVLIVVVMALVMAVLQGEKQRAWRNYQSALVKTKEQIVARLRHPSGHLALMNPERRTSGVIHPVLLPFSAIDFDDRNKAWNAVEMADCLVRYPRLGSLCVGIGNNPWVGGFIYAAGTFTSGPLVAHEIGDRYLDGAHRMLVAVRLRGVEYRWIAPFEALPSKRGALVDGVNGRFTGYVERAGRDYDKRMPERDFRGWLWQEARCADAQQDKHQDCERRSFFSLRLPVVELIAGLPRTRQTLWPPPDLNDIEVDIFLLPPGEDKSRPDALFDSASKGSIAPFSLNDLGALLQEGESLRIQRGSGEEILIRGREGAEERVSPLLAKLIRRLPIAVSDGETGSVAPAELEDVVATPLGDYRILLRGDAERVVNETLGATATRLAWFVGAVMVVIVLVWLVIEIGMIRRIALFTRRARQFSPWCEESEFLAFDFSDLEGSDELGILAGRLDWLLARVREDASRERIRVAQEKEQWHAVGHEIMSPLQSLLALHGNPEDPDYRYLARMQQAIRVLYGSASPSEALQSSAVALATLDLDAFLANIADNASHIGVGNVIYIPRGVPVPVRADEYALEDVISHLLKNADRHRTPDTPITLALDPNGETESGSVTIKIHNAGPGIPPEWLDKIFAYGFSGSTGGEGRRGQGLFVAKTYMAKMGGTIRAANEADGVGFYLSLKRGW